MMRQPRVKAVHSPARLASDRIRIGTFQYGVGAEIVDEDGTIWDLLGLMDGTRTIADVVAAVTEMHPTIDASGVREALDSLIAAGYIEDAGAPASESLSEAEVQRYSRSVDYFAWVDTRPRSSRHALQERLKASRVSLLGLGGAGSRIAVDLVCAGIGALHCADFDAVELSNLNRQALYVESDVGASKVERAAHRLRAINSNVEVTTSECRVRSVDDLAELMRDADLFVLCADKPEREIQNWTNEAALRTGTPWVLSFYAGPMAVTGLFVPYVTPCFGCLVLDESERQDAPRRGELHPLLDQGERNAVISPSATISGGFGALEAIYFLTGLEPQTLGRLFHQNLLIYDHVYWIAPPRRADCPACRGATLAAHQPLVQTP